MGIFTVMIVKIVTRYNGMLMRCFIRNLDLRQPAIPDLTEHDKAGTYVDGVARRVACALHKIITENLFFLGYDKNQSVLKQT